MTNSTEREWEKEIRQGHTIHPCDHWVCDVSKHGDNLSRLVFFIRRTEDESLKKGMVKGVKFGWRTCWNTITSTLDKVERDTPFEEMFDKAFAANSPVSQEQK